MCLIIFAYKSHPKYSLILAANRDEFYSRPTAIANFWEDAPQILAGRDLVAGGTWLGITKKGRFATITNYREPFAESGIKSRGLLTKDFLEGQDYSENYLRKIEAGKNDYSGFNLLVGDFSQEQNEIFYFSNRDANGIRKLSSGIYGLSNHLLDTNWHKVELSKKRFTSVIESSEKFSSDDLFEVLADTLPAFDEKLPVTGVGIERERILSSPFIKTDIYGTRTSTILTIDYGNQVNFVEKTFIGEIGEMKRRFMIEKNP